MGVVEVTLVVIFEDFVGLADSLELGFRLLSTFFGDFVGVVKKGSLCKTGCVSMGYCCWRGIAFVVATEGGVTNLSVCLLDLILRSILINTEELCKMRQM